MDVKLLNPVSMCLKVMQFVGLYQSEDAVEDPQSRRRKIYGRIFFYSTWTILAIAFIMRTLETETFPDMVHSLTYQYVMVYIFIKTSLFIHHQEQFHELNKQLNEICELTNDDERFKKHEQLHGRLRITLLIMKVFGLFTFMIWSLEVILTMHLGRFPINVFKVDDNNCLASFAAIVYLFVLAAYYGFIFNTQNMLPISYLTWAIGFMDELTERVKHIGVSKEFDFDELVHCIKIHQKIKTFVDDINSCYELTYSVQFILSQIMICSLVLDLVNSVSLDQILVSTVFAGLMIIDIFLPCFFYSELEKSSDDLHLAIYQSHWLNCELKSKKLMITFMEMLKIPMQYSCYLIFNINLESFAEIMNAAYSFYCVLASVMEQDD